jgi:RNA polymerase sigma factor (sigma-70 family)
MTDEELLLAFRTSGDNQWMGLLLQRYTTLLLGVAMKYLKERELAEDAVQQIFITALTHLPGEQIHNFKGWLYILTRNHCLQQLRNKTHNAGETALEHLAATGPDNEDIAWQNYTIQQLEGAIEQLGEEQRTSIVLFYLKRCSYEQIIEKTGYTFMQVKSYIQNGKRNLKTILLKKAIKSR